MSPLTLQQAKKKMRTNHLLIGQRLSRIVYRVAPRFRKHRELFPADKPFFQVNGSGYREDIERLGLVLDKVCFARVYSIDQAPTLASGLSRLSRQYGRFAKGDGISADWIRNAAMGSGGAYYLLRYLNLERSPLSAHFRGVHIQVVVPSHAYILIVCQFEPSGRLAFDIEQALTVHQRNLVQWPSPIGLWRRRESIHQVSPDIARQFAYNRRMLRAQYAASALLGRVLGSGLHGKLLWPATECWIANKDGLASVGDGLWRSLGLSADPSSCYTGSGFRIARGNWHGPKDYWRNTAFILERKGASGEDNESGDYLLGVRAVQKLVWPCAVNAAGDLEREVRAEVYNEISRTFSLASGFWIWVSSRYRRSAMRLHRISIMCDGFSTKRMNLGLPDEFLNAHLSVQGRQYSYFETDIDDAVYNGLVRSKEMAKMAMEYHAAWMNRGMGISSLLLAALAVAVSAMAYYYS